MKALIASDIHLEFHPDKGEAFVQNLAKSAGEVDAVILAGDICTPSLIHRTADLFCALFPEVVQISGNHEYYNSTYEVVEGTFAEAMVRHPNLHYLNKSEVVIRGQRILGATLWFANQINKPGWARARWGMADYQVIHDLESWVYDESEAAVAFLTSTMGKGDIVVTHHLPSPTCVAPQYKGSPLNDFFVRDMHKAILKHRPSTWVFGHTHSSVKSKIGGTRMICNPFGYYGQEVNDEFNPKLILDTEPA